MEAAHCTTCTCHKAPRKSARKLPTLDEITGKKVTPARAAALRKLQRSLCGCNRCVYAERDVADPALTYAAHDSRVAEWAQIVETPNTHKEWAALLAN